VVAVFDVAKKRSSHREQPAHPRTSLRRSSGSTLKSALCALPTQYAVSIFQRVAVDRLLRAHPHSLCLWLSLCLCLWAVRGAALATGLPSSPRTSPAHRRAPRLRLSETLAGIPRSPGISGISGISGILLASRGSSCLPVCVCACVRACLLPEGWRRALTRAVSSSRGFPSCSPSPG
jgi:hypothetical protein